MNLRGHRIIGNYITRVGFARIDKTSLHQSRQSPWNDDGAKKRGLREHEFFFCSLICSTISSKRLKSNCTRHLCPPLMTGSFCNIAPSDNVQQHLVLRRQIHHLKIAAPLATCINNRPLRTVIR